MLEIAFNNCNWLISLTITVLAYHAIKLLFVKRNLVNLHGKYVIVTGCGSGFGRAIALRLQEYGFRIIATCRTEEAKARLSQEVSERTMVMPLDVRDSKQIHEVFKVIKRALGPTEGIVLLFKISFRLLQAKNKP